MILRARHLPAALLLLAGCQSSPDASTPLTPVTLDRFRSLVGEGHLDLGPRSPTHASVPDLGDGMLMVRSGEYELLGPTGHGTAAFDGAVIFDATTDAPPSAAGTGSFSLELEGTRYESVDLSSIAAVLPEAGAAGETYLVIGGFELSTDASGREIGSALWAMVPVTDVAAGATITLDGERALAYFGTGPIDGESPELVAVTASGSLTFGDDVPAALEVGASLSASLEGEFGRIDVTDPGPDPGPGPGITPTVLAAGDYTLTFAAASPEVYCDGALAGRESELASLGPAALGLVGGAVSAASPDARTISLSGAAIEASFAAPSIDVLWDDEASFFLGFSEHGGASVAGGTRVGSFVFLAPDDDASGRAAFVGAVFAADPAAPDAGQCQVGWEALIAR
jgi:hypothetical protein